MAKQMAFKDGNRDLWPATYWHPQLICVDKQARTFNAVFYGYETASQRTDNLPSIGQHGYTDGGDPARFDKYFGAAAATKNVFQAAYQVAADTNDVPSQAAPADPLQNTNFFAGATDV